MIKTADPEPINGELLKTQLKSENPEDVANQFLDATRIAGTRGIRFWSGSYWRWLEGRYVELSNDDMRAIVTRFAQQRFRQIRTGDINHVLLNIRATSIIPSAIQPPRWLDGGDESPRTWDSRDTFCTKSHLVHLPGMIDGREDAIVAATPKYFNTIAADYDFDPNAVPPTRWLQFLHDLFGHDLESIELLQQWFGYMLTHDTSHQKILLLIGPKRSGKGTIARVLRSIIGEANCCAPTLASLTTNFGLSPLLGTSAAIIGDARLSGRTDIASTTERLLSISGEDAVTIDRKHKEPVTTQLLTRFTIISNELPRLNDASGALAGRLLILRLAKSFYGNEDRDLLDALLAERQGILLWAIGGWNSLRDAGRFTTPTSTKELVEQMECLGSPVMEFVRDRCDLDSTAEIELDELYTEFSGWCESNGRKSVPEKSVFSRDLTAAFPQLDRPRRNVGGRKKTVIKGLSFK